MDALGGSTTSPPATPDTSSARRATAVVPMVVATDGQWVSRSALAYYAAVHGIAPEAEFLDWIRARDYQPAQPSDEQRALAAAELEAIWSDRQIEGGS